MTPREEADLQEFIAGKFYSLKTNYILVKSMPELEIAACAFAYCETKDKLSVVIDALVYAMNNYEQLSKGREGVNYEQ